MDEAKRLGRMITEHDLDGMPLEVAIEMAAVEVVRRARLSLLFELHDEHMAAGRTNAAVWFLDRIAQEFAESRGESSEELRRVRSLYGKDNPDV